MPRVSQPIRWAPRPYAIAADRTATMITANFSLQIVDRSIGWLSNDERVPNWNSFPKLSVARSGRPTQNPNPTTISTSRPPGKGCNLNSERNPAAATMHQGQNNDRASAIMRTLAFIRRPLRLKNTHENLFEGQRLGRQRLRSIPFQSLQRLRPARAD